MESLIDISAATATVKWTGTVGSRAWRETAVSSSIWTILLLWVTYVIAQCVYNLYFHPLRKIPGPRLAAMTCLYEFWYDAVRGGAYIWEIRKMHEVYGKTAVLAAIAPLLRRSNGAPSYTVGRPNRPYQPERGAHQ